MSRIIVLIVLFCIATDAKADNKISAIGYGNRTSFAYCPACFGGATTVYTYGGMPSGAFGYPWQSYGPFFTESCSYYGPGFGYNYSAWWNQPIDRVGYVSRGYWPLFDFGQLESERAPNKQPHHELAPGTARIRFDVPWSAKVTTAEGDVESHGASRYFITPVLNGPTTSLGEALGLMVHNRKL